MGRERFAPRDGNTRPDERWGGAMRRFLVGCIEQPVARNRNIRPAPSNLLSGHKKNGLRRIRNPFSRLRPEGRKTLFNCVNYCFKCLRLVHGKVSQNLTVQSDALNIEFADKL